MATAATHISRRAKARNWPWRSAAATSHRRRAAGGGHQLPQLRQSGTAGDHGATGGGHRRHVRCLPLLRDAHHGGNVSLYNETLGGGIYPTPVLGIVGLLKIAAPLTIPFINAGRAVVLLGASARAMTFDSVPPSMPRKSSARCGACRRHSISIKKTRAGGHAPDRCWSLAESAHDLSDGGLAVALAECCFGAGQIGAQVDLDSDLRPEILLFHEAPSRILVSTANPKPSWAWRRSTASKPPSSGRPSRTVSRSASAATP